MIIVFQVVSSDVQLYWHKSEGKKEINFNDIPFSVNIGMAKSAIDLSKFDQENLRIKVEQ